VPRLLCLALIFTAACIDAPTFVLDEQATSVSPATPVSGDGDDAMVLVPATALATQGSLSPSAPGPSEQGEKGDGKGKGPDAGGGGGGGGGGGSETDAGVPAPSGSTTTVPAFWIDILEVSARAYATCVSEGKCTAPGAGEGCTVVSGLDDHPANCVTIDQARTFCAARGKRLVKNDEWTAASAGAQQRPYPWGADAPSSAYLNACGTGDCGGLAMYGEADGFARTAPRGSFPAGRTPEGIADLAGNVAEWVDLAGANVARGGSYADDAVAAVSTLSVRTFAGAAPTIGFRCARDQ
jgi:eukaryotic-like serine/threonine-protein kinase